MNANFIISMTLNSSFSEHIKMEFHEKKFRNCLHHSSKIWMRMCSIQIESNNCAKKSNLFMILQKPVTKWIKHTTSQSYTYKQKKKSIQPKQNPKSRKKKKMRSIASNSIHEFQSKRERLHQTQFMNSNPIQKKVTETNSIQVQWFQSKRVIIQLYDTNTVSDSFSPIMN